VGFGLSDDVKRLRNKLGIAPAGARPVRRLRGGQRNDLGAKTAVAKFFGLHLQKSKKISTTNWATSRLTEKQILYAADDAQVALRVYRRWIADGGKVAPQKRRAPACRPPRQPSRLSRPRRAGTVTASHEKKQVHRHQPGRDRRRRAGAGAHPAPVLRGMAAGKQWPRPRALGFPSTTRSMRARRGNR
jgi:hypothetical protein